MVQKKLVTNGYFAEHISSDYSIKDFFNRLVRLMVSLTAYLYYRTIYIK